MNMNVDTNFETLKAERLIIVASSNLSLFCNNYTAYILRHQMFKSDTELD